MRLHEHYRIYVTNITNIHATNIRILINIRFKNNLNNTINSSCKLITAFKTLMKNGINCLNIYISFPKNHNIKSSGLKSGDV